MKLALAVFCVLILRAQEPKNLVVPTTTGGRGVSIRALEIVRETPYPAVIHAKGSVEIRTPVCVITSPLNAQVCDGYLVVHADQADIREDTGQIDPQGHVSITRERFPDRGFDVSGPHGGRQESGA
jgi:hypothetical protein